MLLFSDKIIPPPCAQGTRLGVRLLRHLGNIWLQNYELLGNQARFQQKYSKKQPAPCGMLATYYNLFVDAISAVSGCKGSA